MGMEGGYDNTNCIELSITPNRPDCLGIRGVARDLAASGIGKLKELKFKKIKNTFKHNINVSIDKNSYSLTPLIKITKLNFSFFN